MLISVRQNQFIFTELIYFYVSNRLSTFRCISSTNICILSLVILICILLNSYFSGEMFYAAEHIGKTDAPNSSEIWSSYLFYCVLCTHWQNQIFNILLSWFYILKIKKKIKKNCFYLCTTNSKLCNLAKWFGFYQNSRSVKLRDTCETWPPLWKFGHLSKFWQKYCFSITQYNSVYICYHFGPKNGS